MQTLFDQVFANGVLLVMWGALLFHLILPIPHAAHPTTLWHKFAELLATKVNNNQNYSQSLISGTLAWGLMVLPALVILLALQPLVWQSQLFELALLLLAIDWRNNEKLANQLIKALGREDKATARQLLAPIVNRQTESLSSLGLGKAAAETIIMGYARNVVCVLFWYAIGGGIAALMYRLIVELARAWSPSRNQFAPFGSTAIKIVAILEFIPMRLFALMIVCGDKASHTFKMMLVQSRSWPLPGPAWLITAVGNKLELSLGGPAIYDNTKAIRAKLGGRIAPSALHLSQVQKLLFGRIAIWIFLQSLALLIIHQGI
ncbi:cobalamin biosynthesis family protein [Vibrio lentus]|uniref:cobalamin biosynthesis family protein n=1 Tax=Vibrio lentus TaxID=136468 RepID=UPI000C8506DE|nr:cobalamin biosynthesis family protein [Vibrio lentus]PMI42728.1 adenosylcobinamide-phosphate synthase [Vibrio lentus]PMI63614.1 adenosylcobinamide-phosphate synthase [Vibrio lentus]PMJ51792.1 adenosylcobinamide-phosphate synthase [Vibrio lentus]PMJ63488.1 adenosylcobinamide-phosphate synthase [Vibrio lentus]PMM52945.1 adenosylcobinamide-phosphate synthase [Vibrio lentus]